VPAQEFVLADHPRRQSLQRQTRKKSWSKDRALQKQKRPAGVRGSVDGAMEERRELADFRGEVGKLFGNDGLHAVG
jgi:ribosomal protein L21E